MIELNYRPIPEKKLGDFWKEEIIRIHDAYSSMETRLKYREEKGKILAMPHHYRGSESRLFIGSTKDSIVKYWIGAGALRTNDKGFSRTVLSPSQIENTKFSIHNVKIRDLDARNFTSIRVLD